MLFSIPWDHHRRIIDKCKDDMDKALFFVRKTWENNWGRDALLNWLDTDLYERDGKAVTNFQSTLPERLQIIYADYRGIGKGVER